MRNTFAAALLAGLSLSTPAMADEDSMTIFDGEKNSCVSTMGKHRDFTFTFNTTTNVGRLEGTIHLPTGAHGYHIAPINSLTSHMGRLFKLSITPPNGGLLGNTMVTDINLDHTVFVDPSYSHIVVLMGDGNGGVQDSVLCPVPKI